MNIREPKTLEYNFPVYYSTNTQSTDVVQKHIAHTNRYVVVHVIRGVASLRMYATFEY